LPLIRESPLVSHTLRDLVLANTSKLKKNSWSDADRGVCDAQKQLKIQKAGSNKLDF
jgi:hypothetical protein